MSASAGKADISQRLPNNRDLRVHALVAAADCFRSVDSLSRSSGWLLRSQWRGAANELAARIVAPGIGDQLLDELLGIGSEESLRIPGSGQPSPDCRTALSQRRSPDPCARNQ